MNQPLRVGIAGLGGRGFGMMKACFLPRPNVNVVAVCDLYEDRVAAAVEAVKEAGGCAVGYTDYHQMFAEAQLDAVYIASSWQTHFEITMAAMKAGVATACEVGCGFAIEDCWDLVHTYEETRTPVMLMENCCYGRTEMMLRNMISQGVLGTLIHLRGGYQHDLRSEISYGYINRHYRIDNYKLRNCDNYPTHELGPIAQMLDINRGNRMLSLVSMASKSEGLHAFIAQHDDVTPELHDYKFAQGDVITTMIKCARGETILLTLDTTLPRAYSRGLRVQGTKGMYMDDNHSLFLEHEHEQYDFDWSKQYNNITQYQEKYDHPVWKKYLDEGVQGGHDGMDWLEVSAFLDAVENHKPMPIDVYDFATWMSISVLSEDSIANGSAPVAIPDFTKGKWTIRK